MVLSVFAEFGKSDNWLLNRWRLIGDFTKYLINFDEIISKNNSIISFGVECKGGGVYFYKNSNFIAFLSVSHYFGEKFQNWASDKH